MTDTIFEERTTYSITNEHRGRSSITLPKMVADVLQLHLPDVHGWVQGRYDHVADRKPELTRNEKGDVVRLLAQREAEKHPEYRKMIEDNL